MEVFIAMGVGCAGICGGLAACSRSCSSNAYLRRIASTTFSSDVNYINMATKNNMGKEEWLRFFDSGGCL